MEHLTHKEKITIMIAVVGALFFAAVNQTIVSNALPKIISDLGGLDYYSWVFTSFMLTSSVMTIVAGKLSDIYGRKPFFLIGILFFSLGAFLCGTSESIEQLIAYRAIQGIGAGLIIPTSFAAVGDLFAPRERGKWQGVMTSVFGVSSVLGPTIGGYIVDSLDWKWVFWVFLPLGIVAFFMILKWFPKTERRPNETIDYLGTLFLASTLVTLLIGFSWAGTEYDWSSSIIVSLFTGSIVSLGLFIWAEKRAKSPILPLHLFKYPNFTYSNIIGFGVGVGLFGGVMYVPYFIQGVLGYSATHSSFIAMTMTLGLVVASTWGGQLITKTGKYKRQATIGLMISVVGLLLLSQMGMDVSQWLLVLYLIMVGVGIGMGLTVFTLTVQNAVGAEYLGVATSSTQLFRSIGGTIGVAILGTVLTTSMNEKMASFNPTAIPEESKGALAKFQNPNLLLDHTKIESLRAELPEQWLPIFNNLMLHLQESLTHALSNVFFVAACVMAASALLTFALKEVPLRSQYDEK